jgi:hypothetical protein
MTSNPNVTDSLNALLTQIQSDQLSSSCPTGTVSNINFNDCPPEYSGTYGNTTTDGYYATYTILLKQILNAINLQITSQLFSGTGDSTTETITDNFTFAYVDSLTLEGSASGSGEAYIPEYTYDGCVLWGTTGWKNSCWKSLFGTKYCVPVPSGWGCTEKSTITVPSTYSDSLLISDTVDYELTVNGLYGNGTVTYTLSFVNPDISGNTLYPVYLTIPDVPESVYYIYNIGTENTTFNFTSFEVNGINFDLTNQDVLDILNYFGANLSKYILTYYSDYTFQFLVNVST